MTTPRREASVIFPLVYGGKAYEEREAIRTRWEADVLDTFGGFTHASVYGIWDGENGTRYEDRSLEYRIAARWTPDLECRLMLAAQKLAIETEQECIYVKFENGEVVLITQAGEVT